MKLRHLLPFLPLAALVTLSAANLGLTTDDWEQPDKRPEIQHAEASLSVPSCIRVDTGETFIISISASNMNNLLAWEVYLSYDRNILEVTARDVKLLLSLTDGSKVFDLSDPVPNTKGLYRMAAADLGGEGSAETGSGILATLTLTAKQSGISPTTLARLDFSGDGVADLGPVLTKLGGGHIGNTDGDPASIFDGPLRSGQVAVDTACISPAPESSPQIGPSAAGQTSAPETGTATPDGDTDGGSTSGNGSSAGPSDSEGQPSDGGVSTEVLAATPGGFATATAAAGQTPAGGALSGNDPPSSSGGGVAIWLIAVLAGIGAIGLVTAGTIIRAGRRRPL